MAVGELLLSAFFEVLFDRLASRDLLNFVNQLQGGVYSELKKWQNTLMMIQAVLKDAEEKQTNEAVNIWLDKLRDLAYDAEDILDEFATEAWERKLMAELPDHDHQASTSKVQNYIPTCVGCFNLSTFKFNNRMVSKIKSISSRLEELCKQRIELGLQLTPGGTSSTDSQRRPPSSSVPTEIDLYGRDEDKANILKLVLSDEPIDANFQVIPIVGMAGVGKTTLAREVYNDEKVKVKFDTKAWVCVSVDFDVLSISRALLESITSAACDLKTLNEMQVQLKKAVDRKKILLVLDDVWNEDYSLWKDLKAPFLNAAPKSKIIVTTRHSRVASTMGPIEHYNLKHISDEDCWYVFTKHVFEGRVINTYQISKFRNKVVGKCGGLPLAAKTLGGLLRSSRDDAWYDILNSNILNFPQKNGILPVLRLSYHYLPPHLKRCFAYCAIFPKDYEFEMKELALLWMAEGIIQQSRNDKQLEDWGNKCFDDLVARSIFQQSNSDSSKFIMHDLIHDLAQLVSGETVFRLEDANKRSGGFKRIRHSSYTRDWYDGKNKFKAFYKVEYLRTFMPVCKRGGTDIGYITYMVLFNLLPKLKKLRVLSLQGYFITQLPDSIKDLRLLRYLNLADTKIRSLPESTSSLFNLQILILRDCSRLIELPSNMRNLINLHHLDIAGVNLRAMPLGMKELKNLRTLTNFTVGKGTGSSLHDLRNLHFLCGELCISGLENVTDLQDIREVILRDKKGLEALSLQWRSQADDSQNEMLEENVLGMLQPHTNIKKLTITCYSGKRFPLWIGDPSLSNIVALELINCKNCTSLPAVGKLGSLKHLNIVGMTGLKRIGFEIYGEFCSKPFQSLETLRFEYLEEWEYWDTVKENEHVEIFPCLVELSIVRCPKLSAKLPDHLPSLEKLVISECAELVVSFSSFPMLCKLEVNGCKELVCSTPIDSMAIKSMTITSSSLDIFGRKGMVYNNPTDSKSLLKFVHISNFFEFGKLLKQRVQKVEYLAIGDFSPLIRCRRHSGIFSYEQPVQGLHMVTYPEEVSIEENCISLVSFPEINFLPNNLRSLKIENSRDLKCLPEGMMKNNAQLESLHIRSCPSLTFIVKGNLPSSLKRLEIWSCKKLQSLLDDEQDVCASSSWAASSSSSSSMTLKHLKIWYCSELSALSSRSQLLKALESLYIRDCPKLESIAERFQGNTHLKEIGIVNCKNLKSIPEGLHSLNSLQQIYIRNCPSLVCFPGRGFLSTISSVGIDKCDKLTAFPDNMHDLNSLRYLEIRQCPSLLYFPAEDFPTNLTSLRIEDLKMYKALIQWGLHRLNSLKCLWIHGCHDAKSFPDNEMGMMLPSSLTQLFIFGFLKLKILSSVGFQSLSSLEFLGIYSCPKLTSFPEPGLPSSLLRLYIWNCPLLKRHCKRDKGKEWSKLAHIPNVEIDHKFIYDPEYEG